MNNYILKCEFCSSLIFYGCAWSIITGHKINYCKNVRSSSTDDSKFSKTLFQLFSAQLFKISPESSKIIRLKTSNRKIMFVRTSKSGDEGPCYVTESVTYNHPKTSFFTPLSVATQTIQGLWKISFGWVVSYRSPGIWLKKRSPCWITYPAAFWLTGRIYVWQLLQKQHRYSAHNK